MNLWQLSFAVATLATIIIVTVKILNSEWEDSTALGVALGIVLREVGNLIQGVFGSRRAGQMHKGEDE